MDKIIVDELRKELNQLDKDRLIAMLITAAIDYEGLINRYEQAMTLLVDIEHWDNCPAEYKKIIDDLKKIDQKESN